MRVTGASFSGSPLLVGYARGHPDGFAMAAARGGVDVAESLLSELPDELKPAVVVRMPPTLVGDLLERTPDQRLVDWLSTDDLDAAVGLARRIRDQRFGGLADGLPPRRRQALASHRRYAKDVVGAHVDANVQSVRDTTPVADAASLLGPVTGPRRIPLLVLDSGGRYCGWFDAERALWEGASARAGDCLGSSSPLLATADVRAAKAAFASKGESWLPVVDARGRLVGVLHRSRLPETGSRESPAGSALVTELATAMFDLLGELPALFRVATR